MKTLEILGNDLTEILTHFGIPAKLTYKGEKHEVWEFEPEILSVLCRICDNEWEKWCSDNETFAWFREGGCILEGQDTHEFSVNGKSMNGWVDESELERLNENEADGIEEFDETYWTRDNYSNFTQWLYEVHTLSTERNITYFATSLAKENGMTLAQFMHNYQSDGLVEVNA